MLGSAVGAGPRIWVYSEASLAASALGASGYISNGGKHGMKVNDLVLGMNTSTGIWSGHSVVTVNATTGAVDHNSYSRDAVRVRAQHTACHDTARYVSETVQTNYFV